MSASPQYHTYNSPRSSSTSSYGQRIFSDMNKVGDIQWSKIFQTQDIPLATRIHLQHVYRTVGYLLLTAFCGGYFGSPYINTTIAGIIVLISSLWFSFSTPISTIFGLPSSTLLLHTIAFFTGVTTTPLISVAMAIDPQIVVLSIISTAVLFIGCSIAALRAPNTQVLAIYTAFTGVITMMFVVSSTLLLFGTQLFSNVIYIGISLVMVLLHIVLNTQSIIQRFEINRDDAYEYHALMLFMDLIRLFGHILRLLILLSDKEKNQRNRRRNNRDQYNDNYNRY